MKNLKTIILAAGRGIRMKSECPKVLHPVCGRPMIHYVLKAAQSFTNAKIYVVLGHQNRTVKDYIGRGAVTVIQKKLLGTADAVKCAAGCLRGGKGDCLILCGDTPLLLKETIKNLVKKHKEVNAACTFLTAIF